MRTTAAGEAYAPADQLTGFERARLAWRLLRDPRVSSWAKAAVPLFALAYVVLPIDLIPDFILGLGQIDDLSVIGISIFAMTKIMPRLAPKRVVAEHLDEMRGNGWPRRSPGPPEQTVYDASFRVVSDHPSGRKAGGQTGWGTKR